MKQIINQNIQPIIYKNKNFPLSFAYIIAQSAIINADQPIPENGNIVENPDFCLPKGLNIRTKGPVVSIAKSVSAMSRSGTLVTVTSNSHGLTTGTTIEVSGASPTAYNGTFQIVVTGNNTFTYTVGASGSDTASGNIVLNSLSQTYTNVAIDKDRLVWITGKGAYITQESAWVSVPEVTNLLNNSTKIYATDENGSYLVFDPTDIADPFNQIKRLNTNEGYLVISNKAGQIPDYVWYDTIDQDLSNYNNPKVSFVYTQCATNINVEDNQKAIKLADIEGVCDTYKKAGTTLTIRLEKLRKGYNYKVRFIDYSDTGVVFENEELYYGNNQLDIININNNIDITKNLNNNIVNISILLYENDVLISSDSLGIYINCPIAPPIINPPLIRPRFYLVGED